MSLAQAKKGIWSLAPNPLRSGKLMKSLPRRQCRGFVVLDNSHNVDIHGGATSSDGIVYIPPALVRPRRRGHDGDRGGLYSIYVLVVVPFFLLC